MKRYSAIPLLTALFFTASAHAGIDEVYSPLVTNHKLEFEYKVSRLSDSGKALDNAQSHEVEMTYGFSNDLRLGLLGQADRASSSPFNVTGYGAQALYTTTHQGDWWLNSGVLGEFVAANHDHTPDSAEGRLLLSRVQGPVTVNANFIFGREIGEKRSSGVGFGSSLQGLYDIGNDHVMPGVEWYGDFGKLNHFSHGNQQQHYVGPILTGGIVEFGRSEIDYTAGYYWGVTHNSADHAARIEIDYELQF